MECKATNIEQSLEPNINLFFLYGSEIALKEDCLNKIYIHLKKMGFNSKAIIDEDDIGTLEEKLTSNTGSLFNDNLIYKLNLTSKKISKELSEIIALEEILNNKNTSLIIDSPIDNIRKNDKWYKSIINKGLLVKCEKLKLYEEKIWLKKKLSFLSADLSEKFFRKIFEMNQGNLIAQNNEVKILKLIPNENLNNHYINDLAEFSPYELEDLILNKDQKEALRIINKIHNNESHYGPVLIWVLARVINSCIDALLSKNSFNALKNAGIWDSKIPYYQKYFSGKEIKNMLSLQKNLIELELSLKGSSKKNFWESLENLVIKLT